MRSRKKVWLSGSVLVGVAAVAASFAIPLASATAKHPAKIGHCHVKYDAVVDISQFENDLLAVDAKNGNCSVSLTNGSYKPGALIAPVTANVKVKPNTDGTPGLTGQIKTKTFTGTIIVNPSVCDPCGAFKVKVKVGVDFKPPSAFIEVKF